MRLYRRAIRAALLAAGLAPAALLAGGGDQRAELILNFAKYAHWPQADSPQQQGRWSICLVSADQSLLTGFSALDLLELDGLPVELVELAELEDSGHGANATYCHLLYLSQQLPATQLLAWLAVTRDRPILTISDYPEFAQSGGMIEMLPDDGRYRFDVDYRQVQRNGLKLASGMLKMARAVHTHTP